MTNHPFTGILCLATSAAACLATLSLLSPAWPPLMAPQHFPSFVDDVGAFGAGIGLVATLAACGAGYVLVVSVVAAVAATRRPQGIWTGVARAITIPALRWALPGAVGLAILVAPAGPASASTPHDDDTIVMLADEPAEFRLIGPTATSIATTTTAPPATTTPATADAPAPSTTPPATTHRITGTAPATTAESTTTGRPSIPAKPATAGGPPTTETPATTVPMAKPAVPVPVPARESGRSRSSRTWTVAPGDHLWHIAQATLAGESGPQPTDAATLAYCQQLIAANRAQLVDPNNPDLILPGQHLDLPVRNG